MMEVSESAKAKRQIVSQKYRQSADKVSTVVFIAATIESNPKSVVKHKRASERRFGAPALRSDLRSRFPLDSSFLEGNSFINSRNRQKQCQVHTWLERPVWLYDVKD